jgi:hypothetical protein
VLRSAGGLMSSARTEQLWESAISRMTVVMEDQFSRMQTANHLLLVKDYVSLLGATLRRYGYQVAMPRLYINHCIVWFFCLMYVCQMRTWQKV